MQIGSFCKAIFYLQKEPSLLLNGEVIWQTSDSSLTKELHASFISDHLKNAYNIQLNVFDH